MNIISMLLKAESALMEVKELLNRRFLITAFADSGLTFANTSRHDPYKTFNYRVTITGKKNFARAGFSKVSGLSASSEAVEYRDGDDSNLNVRSSAGLTSYEPVTLERGMSEDTDMFDWFSLNVNTNGNAGQADHNMQCSVLIELLDRDRTTVKSWELLDAWPSEYTTADLEATSNNIAIETLTFRHNGIKFTNGRAS